LYNEFEEDAGAVLVLMVLVAVMVDEPGVFDNDGELDDVD
jgi:hypothetical protein